MTTSAARLLLAPMTPRDPEEPGRAASPLELFFDLVFVVAVSITAAELHHSLSEGHVGHGLLSYAVVFFAIWWAWMNFTWFATSFATDDWLYRLLTLLQMSGVLVLAAGVQPAFADDDLTVVVIAYVVMRVALVAQWARAALSSPGLRATATTFAVGVAVVQALWLLMLLLPHGAQLVAVPVLILAEVAVPVVAEGRGNTPWHPHHITERYGLFTLILLGESLLASANAVIEALREDEALAPLVSISVLAFVVTAALWWIYFWPPHHRAIGSIGQSLRYGYTHYLVFAAAGALSAGVEVLVDVETGSSRLGPVAADYTVAVPVAVFLLGIWWVALRTVRDRVVDVVVPLGAALALLDPLSPLPLTVTTVVLVALVVTLVVRRPPAD